MKRPLISNITISSINASECREGDLGEIALSRFKLGARLMMGEKGTLIQMDKRHSTGMKTGTYENSKLAFVDGNGAQNRF